MTPQSSAKQKGVIYALLALGFAGLIGAHELAVTPPQPGADASTAAPLILAALGTLCFIVAGLLARKLMRDGASK